MVVSRRTEERQTKRKRTGRRKRTWKSKRMGRNKRTEGGWGGQEEGQGKVRGGRGFRGRTDTRGGWKNMYSF